MLQFPDPEPRPATGTRPPVELIEGREDAGLIILCDHASNHVPAEYGDLGVARHVLASHVGYDIGSRGVAAALAELAGVPAVLTKFSRLLIDPNRGEDDPTLIMRIADGSIIEGNVGIDEDEVRRRIATYHAPYHNAIDAAIERAIMAGRPPAILSVHSFTPRFKMVDRPWHVTILWDSDPRLPRPLLEALEAEPDLVVGENVPYSGKLRGDTLFHHATLRGLAHALIEIRQDLIATPEGQRQWAERLNLLLGPIMERQGLDEIKFFGTHTSG